MAENIQIKINAAVEGAQAAQTIGQLKKSLTELQELAEQSDLGSEQFQQLQNQIVQTNASLAASRDRLGDIQDKISTLEGTPVERLNNSFNLLKQSIFSLDFEKAKIGVEGLINAFTPLGPDGAPLKGLKALGPTLKGLSGGVMSLGQTFITLGRTLLVNPIFLLASAIAAIAVGIVLLLNKLGLLTPILDAIGAAVEYVTDSFNSFTEAIGLNTAASEKNVAKIVEAESKKRAEIEKTLATQERVSAAVQDLTSTQIQAINQIAGTYVKGEEGIAASRLASSKKLIDSYNKEIKAFEDLQKKKGKLSDDEKKQYDELIAKAQDANVKLVEITAERYRKVSSQLEQNQLEGIALEKNELVRAQKLKDAKIEIANKENLEKIALLQDNQKLQDKLKMSYNAEEIKATKRQIELNQNEIKAITDARALDRLKAEKDYLDEVTRINKENADKRKQQITDEKNAKKKAIEEEILLEENKFSKLLLDDKVTSEQRVDAEIALERFRLKKKLEITTLSDKSQLNLFFETEGQKEEFRIKQEQKILDIQKKFSNEKATLDERLEAIKKARQQLELDANQDNLLIVEAINRARLKEIELESQILLSQPESITQKEKLLALDQEKLKITQQLNAITKEQLQKETESQRQILETRVAALKIIKDNNLSVNADILKDTSKTQQLINDINTKGSSVLASIDAMTKKQKLENLDALKNAELELLKFNFEQEAVKRAELQGTSTFIANLATVDLELTKKYNADKLAITKQYSEAERATIKLSEDEKINIARGALQQISDLSNLLFDIQLDNNKKGAKEEEKIARQKFEVNKALQLGLAVIDGYKAITTSLSQSPVAIGPVPNPAGIASLAFAISTSAINIARILASRYKSTGAAPSAGAPNVPSITSSGAAPGEAAQFTAPTFFGLGGEQRQVTPGPLQQRVYVVESDITSTQNRVAVLENRAVIE